MTTTKKNIKPLVAALILFIWLAASTILLWYYFAAPLRPFADYEALRDVDFIRLDSQAPSSAYTMLHFEDPACYCTRYSRDHVQELKLAFPDTNHYTVLPGNVHSQLKAIGLSVDKPLNKWLVTSPSVAIFDAQGGIVYYGPYSAGATCGEGFDFVRDLMARADTNDDNKKTYLDLDLNALANKADRSKVWQNLSAFGCYCDWPN